MKNTGIKLFHLSAEAKVVPILEPFKLFLFL